MPKLIDAEKLAEYKASGVSDLTEWQKGWNDAIDTIMGETPTVDAEPVRHGHWEDMGDFESCSVCHGTHLKVYQTCYGKMTWVNMSYCPNCGAKMDEVEDE